MHTHVHLVVGPNWGPTNQWDQGGSTDLDGPYLRIKSEAHQIILTHSSMVNKFNDFISKRKKWTVKAIVRSIWIGVKKRKEKKGISDYQGSVCGFLVLLFLFSIFVCVPHSRAYLMTHLNGSNPLNNKKSLFLTLTSMNCVGFDGSNFYGAKLVGH